MESEERYEALKKENEILRILFLLQAKELRRLQKEKRMLEEENQRLKGQLGRDGTNSGTPTSQTPINKKKVVPNTRKKSGKKRGGQPGHHKAELSPFCPEEVTETVEHDADHCPYCGSREMKKTGKTVIKDELDYEFVAVKRRHVYSEYRCEKCGKKFHAPMEENLRQTAQYGLHVQALALTLTNVGYVSLERTRKMICGLSEGEIDPSEGYIVKLQKRAAKALASFMAELRSKCFTLPTLYWDDTVIFVDQKRACLRFYGDEKYALYTAHMHKDKAGLDEDSILGKLSKQTVVMHDHNRVNYNEDYCFINVECNVHLLRDLQKVTDHLKHTWSGELKDLLEKTNAHRNEVIQEGKTEFNTEEIQQFFEKLDQIMLTAIRENKEAGECFYASEERALIVRIAEYKANYFGWVTNFDIPFSNNLSERSLRGVKSKHKISGQFQNIENAQYFAAIKSYMETCSRNHVNPVLALQRLCAGTPFSLTEITAISGDLS